MALKILSHMQDTTNDSVGMVLSRFLNQGSVDRVDAAERTENFRNLFNPIHDLGG